MLVDYVHPARTRKFSYTFRSCDKMMNHKTSHAYGQGCAIVNSLTLNQNDAVTLKFKRNVTDIRFLLPNDVGKFHLKIVSIPLNF